MAEAPAQPATPQQEPAPPLKQSTRQSTAQFSVSEIASSRANAWGVRPALIRAALHGKDRVSMAEAESLVKAFAKKEA